MPKVVNGLRRLMTGLHHRAAELSACAFATGWFFYLGYGPTLRPTNIEWMLHDDWAAYFWGFSFFRNAEWSWPLGNIPELYWPFGTSIGFTDANPWMSLFFKLLSPALPVDFQFSGMWFLLCFVLYAWLGTRIGALFTEDKVRRALCGMLFAASPLLPSRHVHIALCGFFFVAAGVYMNLAPARARADAVRLMWQAYLWLAWAAGTHGYLSVMLLILSIATCVRLAAVERLLRPWEAALSVAACVAITLAVYWLFGYIGWRPMDLTAQGFGEFSGDLTALVNPMQWSRLMPGMKLAPRQMEGFSYLGLGILLLLLVRVAATLRAPAAAWRAFCRQWPLVASVLAMWIYSWSSHVAFRGETALDVSALYAPFSALTDIFRSSGRFSWPLHVVLVCAALSAAIGIQNRGVSRFVLLLALVVQTGELKVSNLDFRGVRLNRLEHPAWKQSEASYQHLALVPLHLLWVCRYNHPLVNRLSYEAYRRRWTFNSGNFMRKQADARALCDAPVTPDAHTIYAVVGTRLLPAFPRSEFVCGRLDGLTVCVSAARLTPLLSALSADPRGR
jgi:hypothetical protein